MQNCIVKMAEETTDGGRFVYTLFTDSENEGKSYGISVNDLKNDIKMCINSVTTVESKAKTFYNVIKGNLVYPEHLKDVIYELIVKDTEV